MEYIYYIVIDNVCACMFWPHFKSSAIVGKMTEERKLGGKEYRQFQMLDIKEENVAVCLVEVRE